MQSKIILGAASIALLGASAMAFPQTAKPQGDKPTPQTERPANASMPTANKMFCNKASDVLGAKVRNAQKAEIGEVEDLIVDPTTGRIEFAVVSIDARKPGDQWYAVPFQKLTLPYAMDKDTLEAGSTDKERDAKKDMREPEFVLDLDQAKLDTAPGFNKDKWPDLNAPAWRTDLERFYGTTRTGETAGSGDVVGTQPRAVRVSKVLDQKVRTTADENLGEVEELVVDPKNARIAFLVVSTGGFLGMGEKMHAIPWEAARAKARTDKDNDELIVNVTKDRLTKAPEFKKDDWVRLNDPTYMNEVYTYYGSRPYWSDTNMKSGKPMDHEKDRKDDKGSDPR